MTAELQTAQITSEIVISFAESVSRVTGSASDEIRDQISLGLLPFLSLAARFPGDVFPSPIVFELIDHTKSYGPESLRVRLQGLRISEPETDAGALAAYKHTLELLSQEGVPLDAAIWPTADTFVSASGNYK